MDILILTEVLIQPFKLPRNKDILKQWVGYTIVVTRGNTGVGKSYWIQQSLMQHVLPQYLKTYLHEHDDFVHGVLNPDHIKATLKKIDRHSLLNSQVYLEGRIIFERFLKY